MTTDDQQSDCLFCKITNKVLSAHLIFENKEHIAFLTPFPNTPGFSVVIPKKHYSSYGFSAPENILLELIKTAKEVAILIDKRLKVKRTGLIMEGYGIDHLHAKLFPMHGIPDGAWKPILSEDKTFHNRYAGMIASNDGPRMSDAELSQIATKIRSGR